MQRRPRLSAVLRSDVCKRVFQHCSGSARLLCGAPDDLLHLLGLLPLALRRRPHGAQIVPRFDWRVHNLNTLRSHFAVHSNGTPNGVWVTLLVRMLIGMRRSTSGVRRQAAHTIDADADTLTGTDCIALRWAFTPIYSLAVRTSVLLR